MANTIALKLVIDGTEQAIKSMDDLKLAIRQGEEQLGKLELGSQAYKKLATEIKGAKSQLEDLDEGLKGLDLEKRVGLYAKIGSAVASSFAGAQAAVALFGGETEEIAKAAAKAQNLLTIALTAREVAEGLVSLTAVAATTATQAETVATNTLTASLQRLYATVVANPFGALIAGLAAVGAALYYFGKATDDTAKKSAELQKQVNKDATKEITDTKALINTVDNYSLSIQTREKAVKDLTQKFPAYFEGLNKEDILSGKVKISTDTLTQAIVRQSMARALQARIEERSVGLLEAQDKVNKAKAELAKLEADKSTALISGGGSVGIGGGQVQAGAQATQLLRIQGELQAAQKVQKQLNDQNEADFKQINQLQIQNNSVIGTATEVTKANTEAKNANNQATKEQIALQKEFEDELNKFAKDITKITAVFNKLGETMKFDIASPQLLNDLKSLTTTIDGLIPPTVVENFAKIGLGIEIVNGKFKVLSNTFVESEDTFGLFIDQARKALSADAIDPDKTLEETIKRINNEASKLFQEGLISKDALDTALKLTEQYKQFEYIITALPKSAKEVFSTEILNEYLTATKNVGIALGEIKYEKVGDEIVKIDGDIQNLTESQEKLIAVQSKFRTLLIEGYKTDFIENNKFNKASFDSLVKKLVAEGRLQQEQADNLLKLKADNAAEQLKLINELADAQVNALNKTTTAIVNEETQIRDFLFQIQEERKKGLEAQTKALPTVVLQNLELLDKELSKSGQIQIDTTKTTEEQISSLITQFQQKRLSLIGYTQEEIDKILQFYLDKQDKARDDAAKKELTRQEKFKEQTSKILSEIQVFQGALTSLSQYTNDYYTFQLSQLEKRNEKAQSQIIGDSKEAAALRIETEQQYQAQREKLEKQAAKRSLQITKAQAIANFAASLVKITEQTGVFAVFATAAISIINAKQIALIQSQIDALDSYQRGGIIKAQGGLISGPSHEFGGVMLGGGINAEGGESIINRQSTIKYGSLLSQINQSGGGKPLVNNFDDSRIVEALAKQKSEPIRAYVVEQDITSKQAVTRRLQELSRI